MIDGAFPFVKGDEILGGQEKMQTWKNHCCKEAAVWIPKKNDSNLSLDRKRAAILFPKPNDGNLDEKQTDVTVPDQFFFPTNNGKVILSSHFLTHQFVQTLGQRLKQKESTYAYRNRVAESYQLSYDNLTAEVDKIFNIEQNPINCQTLLSQFTAILRCIKAFRDNAAVETKTLVKEQQKKN